MNTKACVSYLFGFFCLALGVAGCNNSSGIAPNTAVTSKTGWSVISNGLPGFFQSKSVFASNALYVVGLRPTDPKDASIGQSLEVWKSTDGGTWAQVTVNGSAPLPFQDFAIATNGSVILLTGGRTSTNHACTFNDDNTAKTTSTKNCQILQFDPSTSKWTVLVNSELFASYYHSMSFVNGKFIFVDARDDNGLYRSLATSANGISWATVSDTGMGVRLGACVTNDGSNLYLIGGANGSNVNMKDVWMSTDTGSTWVKQTETLATDMASFGGGCAVNNGKLYYMGGHNAVDVNSSAFTFKEPSNKVYVSSDQGKTWVAESNAVGNDTLLSVGWFGLTAAGGKLYWSSGYNRTENTVSPYVYRSNW